MTPNQLQRVLLQALSHAIADGELPASAATGPERVTLRKPPHGDADFASPLALRLAPVTGHSAREIAEILRDRLAQEEEIGRAEVAGPGFLNITLRRSAHTELVRTLLTRRPDGRTAHGTSPTEAPDQRDVPDQRDTPDQRDVPEQWDVPELPVPPEDPAADAARWAALTGSAISYERRDSQPLFRIQYARSRSWALVEGARALGFTAEPGDYRRRSELALLTLLADTAHLADRTRTRADARADARAATHARDGRPSGADEPPVGGPALAHHLRAVADAFLTFTSAPGAPSVLPRGDEKPEAAHRSRLALAEATGTVLAGGLSQLGISAPHYL
ncbi:hypothetical protein JGS22_001715 [Streptomyces sp. P38-E01]|uniref:Arginine--tRNA ligase n=1 Tax=Streptomyces tardus TaxID=2780544 RepID=A0A949N6W0_9ACTN|nr:DALR anticodon-binding domain-containing protein [Streptomyces tardus]MBU7596388.1 hypothetical protein [Streptomyces tardus]